MDNIGWSILRLCEIYEYMPYNNCMYGFFFGASLAKAFKVPSSNEIYKYEMTALHVNEVMFLTCYGLFIRSNCIS